jgi:hypothetical protein
MARLLGPLLRKRIKAASTNCVLLRAHHPFAEAGS